ncbi:GIY-YIG nuclease family protein [Romeria aff. gracilis LEGE 07310]|uniref:GIY-YIG nuclease family protein n=1 Tax=Vasconcelosia minhoensis LEGE 07310 TaxID=915328 RepID=A0A8J7AGZ5_9CYAN|nr:GIY-YIG nuclease family protein [Romeria gracilis]MBE9078749.1 GIY-YIG nuclease family protein [Romeria aff. gracilis LEGE 07310]
MDRQGFLLSESQLRAVGQSHYENFRAAAPVGTAELRDWKRRVAKFQTTVGLAPAAEQTTLFDLAAADSQAEGLNPFELPPQNTEFWRWRFSDVGVAAMYFVIDYAAPLLLYVGETVKSNQRWKGEHDCKRYLVNYRQAHYQNQMTSQLGIAFWPHAPSQRRARQTLESRLIYKWRSPFNKENWDFWKTPFVSGKGELR